MVFGISNSLSTMVSRWGRIWKDRCRRIVTGRSMDWVEDMQTNLWVFPRGMKRDGGLGKGSLEWTSKYGSVAASVYEGGTADGMNKKGLIANFLYLAESEYSAANDKRPGMCIIAWAQCLLDNFATVNDAVAEIKKDAFRVVPVEAPNGAKGTVHLSISDSSGDLRICERQVDHPSWQGIPADDQLADLRQATCDQRILERIRRGRDAAWYRSSGRPLRACFLYILTRACSRPSLVNLWQRYSV